VCERVRGVLKAACFVDPGRERKRERESERESARE
jgi:hypothetical protein